MEKAVAIPTLSKPVFLVHIAKFSCKNFKESLVFSMVNKAFEDSMYNYALPNGYVEKAIPLPISLKVFLSIGCDLMRSFVCDRKFLHWFNGHPYMLYSCDNLANIDFFISINKGKLNNSSVKKLKIDGNYKKIVMSLNEKNFNLENISSNMFPYVIKYWGERPVIFGNQEIANLIVKYIPDVKELTGNSPVRSQEYLVELSKLIDLESLCLRFNGQINITEGFAKLKKLSLSFVPLVERLDIPSLEFFHLNECSSLVANLNSLKKLEELILEKISFIDCSLFADLHLTKLKIKNVSKLSNFETITTDFLECLELENHTLKEKILPTISKCSRLKSINLNFSEFVFSSDLKFLHGLGNLTSISLSQCKGIEIEDLHKVVLAHKKASFSLENSSINKSYTRSITEKKIVAENKNFIDDQIMSYLVEFGITISDEFSLCHQKITSIEFLKSIRILSLDLSGCDITDEGFYIFSKSFKKLHTLKLESCRYIDNFDFLFLFPKLKFLNVSSTKFDFRLLYKLSGLESVNFTNCIREKDLEDFEKYLSHAKKIGLTFYSSMPEIRNHLANLCDLYRNSLHEGIVYLQDTKNDKYIRSYVKFGTSVGRITINNSDSFHLLENFPNLRYLIIDCEFTNLDEILKLKKLTHLRFSKNSSRVENISALSVLNLELLSFVLKDNVEVNPSVFDNFRFLNCVEYGNTGNRYREIFRRYFEKRQIRICFLN